MKSKKSFAIIGVFFLIMMLIATTYAFFNYTRTGRANVLKVGRISFNATEGARINLTNVFPVASSAIDTDTDNVGSVTINVKGDTTYSEGIEYLVTAVDVSNTIGTGDNEKTIPINIDVSIENNSENDPATTLGVSDDDYFDNRESTETSLYKVLANETVKDNDKLLVGYIKSGATGIDGNIVIKAYLDTNKIAITDTYNDQLVDDEAEIDDGIDYDSLVYTDESCFTTNGGTIIDYDESCGTDVVIPRTINGVTITKIGNDGYYDGAFESKGLTSVVIPNTVTIIDHDAFENNYSLQSIIIPNSVITIGNGAFSSCNLQSVTFGNNVTTIGDGAFAYNYNLQSIVIPNSVTTIRGGAFIQCDLRTIELGSSVTEIGERAFEIDLGPEGDYLSNLNLTQIVNKTGRSFVWGNILGNSNGNASNTFVSGTYTYTYYNDETITTIVDGSSNSTNNNSSSYSNGTTSRWVAGRTVMTTEEWNSIQSTGLSFKVKVEANEGIWVRDSENLANLIKSRLGQDGIVAVNSSGDLYDGTGTIREYRYSGIGNYCTYTDGTNNYNISVEGTDCPEHAYKGNEGYIAIGSSDGFSLWGTNNETELNRVNTTATDSGLRNYIMFNNEKWRIIGVFGNNVKIMKDLPLTEDLTSNPTGLLDTNGANDNQIYTNTLSEQYLIKYVAYENQHKYGYFMYNYPGDSNYTYNWNDWTHSGLMYYLNENNTGSYYNTIGAIYKSLIDDTTYYLGNVSILNGDANGLWVVDGTAKEVYEQERGNVECASSVTSWTQNSNCNIWNGNSATWTGKIGLLYPSDYGYASSSDKWSTNEGAYYYNGGSLNNWMFNTDAGGSWMISPTSDDSLFAIEWDHSGSVGSYDVNYDYGARPVLNLISEAEVVDGDGSYSNPYILNIE